MTDNCTICDQIGKIELHHILPKSKGGSDDSNNLVGVCESCHGKIHDISMSGRSGLVANGLRVRANKCQADQDWLEKKNVDVFTYLMDVYDFDPELHSFVLFAINHELCGASEIRNMYKTGTLAIKGKIKVP